MKNSFQYKNFRGFFKNFKYIIAVTLLMFLYNNCSNTNGTEEAATTLGTPLDCTIIGTLDSINLKINKQYNKNSVYAYSINTDGDEVQYDQCNTFQTSEPFTLYDPRIIIEDSFMQFYLIESLVETYVKDGRPPLSNDLSIKIYSRNNCNSPRSLSDEFSGQITWTPTELDGKDCSTIYDGTIEF